MPWSAPRVIDLRTAFVHAVRTAKRPLAVACREFRISRKTGYKWLARFDAQQTLGDRSRKPMHSPRRSSEALENAVLAVREQFGWGPRKIVAHLRNQNLPHPPVRTAAAILRRHGRVAAPAPPEPDELQRFERPQPNQLWQIDFKGYVEVARRKVFPLTVLDDHSRFLLAIPCGHNVTMARAWDDLWNVFGEYGLPDAILCDNAFGTWGPGISWFEARMMRLGIRVAHGRPYHPQTQGKVERFHGTLEAEIFPRLPRDTLEGFQTGLDQWRRHVYNAIRPHEALGDVAPVTRWRPCERRRPLQLPAVEYSENAVLRRVGSVGDVRWRGAKLLAGNGLVGEFVRIEETDNLINLWYGSHCIRQIPRDQLRTSGIL